MSYPEHDKLREIQHKSQACGEFLEWLLGPQRYVIGEYHSHDAFCTERGVKLCGMITGGIYPAPVNIRKLLAQFFEIDEDVLEEEKRAMLGIG
jgi:hypothetical protein